MAVLVLLVVPELDLLSTTEQVAIALLLMEATKDCPSSLQINTNIILITIT